MGTETWYVKILSPNKAAPLHVYISKMPQILPKNENMSASLDRLKRTLDTFHIHVI